MAVPFYVPDEEHEVGSSSQPQSTTKSAAPTPLQSLTNEHLVQILYDTLSMYSASLLLLNIISHGKDKDVDVIEVQFNDKNGDTEIVLLFEPIRIVHLRKLDYLNNNPKMIKKPVLTVLKCLVNSVLRHDDFPTITKKIRNDDSNKWASCKRLAAEQSHSVPIFE